MRPFVASALASFFLAIPALASGIEPGEIAAPGSLRCRGEQGDRRKLHQQLDIALRADGSFTYREDFRGPGRRETRQETGVFETREGEAFEPRVSLYRQNPENRLERLGEIQVSINRDRALFASASEPEEAIALGCEAMP